MLRDLARVASREDIEFFVIGAGARFLVYDWPLRLHGGRGTTDWDIAVRLSSWNAFERLKVTLTAKEAPFEATAAAHRLRHLGGRSLDIVPFGGLEAADRTVTYPHEAATHSVLGLRECEDCCTDVDIGEGVSVRVVAPPGLVLLKAKAYLDRRPMKTHDLQDLDFMVETFRDTVDDQAVFDRSATVLQEEVVLHEDVGAYLLAAEVRELGVASQATEPLLELVDELMDPRSHAVDDLLRSAAHAQARQRTSIARRYAAFKAGLSDV